MKSCRECRYGEERPQVGKPSIVVCCYPGIPKEVIYDPEGGACPSWKLKNKLMRPNRSSWVETT